MTTQELECFVSVANHLSFARAARELYFSVATVSHHIQHLEDELHVTLFVRNRHGVNLTMAGRIFLTDAAAILQQEHTALDRLRDNGKNRELRFGCASQAEIMLLQPALISLRRRFPETEPVIMIDAYDRLIDRTVSGFQDFMFASSHMAKKSGLQFKKFTLMRTCAVLPGDHPLAGKAVLSFDDLEGAELISPRQNLIPSESNNPVRDLLNIHSLHHHDLFPENDEVIVAMVQAGYGIGVLPEYRIRSNLESQNLKVIPIRENVDFPYGVLYRDLPKREDVVFFLKAAEKILLMHGAKNCGIITK